jgi:autotransporter-associated beta strand protein
VTTVFGQVTLTNVGPNFSDIGFATNWNPSAQPNPDNPNNTTAGAGDQIVWDGQTPGLLTDVCQSGNLTGASGSTIGLYVFISANQTAPVTIISSNGLGGALRLQSVTNNGGGITLGDNGTGNTVNTIWGGINGQIQNLYNAVPGTTCTINSGFQMRMGGGGAHNFTFDGPGNWNVTNDMNNANGPSACLVTKNGTGTMVWYSTNNPNQANNGTIGSPVAINGGIMILKTSDSFRSVNIGPVNITDNAFLEYDDVNPAGGGKLSGNITGSGTLQVNSGTLTLSGQNTYAGSNILSGGELIANSPESVGLFGPLGTGSTISLTGGTLGYGPLNAFDYSPRFDTAANQQYNIDTGGQFVFYGTPLASSGSSLLNKIGAGVLTLTAGASYSGPTHVSGGKLVFQGPMTGTGNITVDDAAALGVFANGTQVSPGTLTLGSSAGAILEFNTVNSTTTAPLKAGTIASTGTQVINVNSGTFIVGQTYPLLSWTSGTPPAVTLGILNGFIGNLQTNGNSIGLFIVATAFSWTGAANSFWDLTSVDWLQNGSPVMITNNAPAILDDSSTETNVTFETLAAPTVATFNNNTNPYTLVSTVNSNLSGSAKLFMAGSSTLTLSGANTYTGVTTLGSGTIIVTNLANGGSASDIGQASSASSNIVFNGGVLRYFGGTVTIDRLFTLNSFGGTIDNEGTGQLTITSTFTNGMAGGGARTLTWNTATSTNDILGSVLPDGSGATAVVKQGAGTLILTGNNINSGLTTINNGILQVGNGGSTGTMGNGGAQDNTALVFNRSGTVTVFGPINGNGTVTQNGTGTVILANDNGFSGGLTINSGTVQVGNGGPTGSLLQTGPIVDNGTLIFNSTGSFSYTVAGISGTGNVIVAAGAARPSAPNSYTGWTQINAGATYQPCKGQDGTLVSSVVTNNGTLQFQCQDIGRFGYAGPIYGTGRVFEDNNNQNTGSAALTGTNSYVGGTWIAGGNLLLGDGATAGAGALFPSSTTNVVIFTNAAINDNDNRGLIFNRPDSFTFSNHILGKTVIGGGTGNPGTVFLLGSATVTLIGTNTYQGGTTVSNGALIVGNGGGTGAIGSGNVNDQTAITFNRSGTLNVPGNFGGIGTVAMVGTGVVNLTGFHAGLSGSSAVSNGILGIANSIGGEVDVAGGTLAVGGYQTAGALSIGNSTVSPAVAANLNIQSGFLSMALNTAQAQSNSFVQMTVTNTLTTFTTNLDNSITTNVTVTSATGTINYTGGTLQLINVGPTLQVGQRFVLFSQPIAAPIPIVTLGNFTVTDNLALDGSVTVATVAPPVPPSFNSRPRIVNGTNLTFNATNNFGPGGSWDLVATNNLHSPVGNWPVVQSGHFDGNGNVTLTTPVSTNLQFFDLRAP